MIDEVRVRVDRRKRIYRACMEMAQVFGIGYILDQRGPEGQLARSAPDEGIPTIDPELGGCIGWDRESIHKGITGVENVLKYYGVIPGEPFIPKKQVVVDGFLTVLANRGGFIEFHAQHYDLQKGDPVADITDPFWQCARDIARARGIDFLVGKFVADGIKWRDGGDFGEELFGMSEATQCRQNLNFSRNFAAPFSPMPASTSAQSTRLRWAST